ncbi:MAG: hypothetical protein LBT78_10235 [Tannerella sp.]|jgi:N-acetylglucosamine-6-phosphate deacetylase|nr:hypothetical protein [Tannerella sp.]
MHGLHHYLIDNDINDLLHICRILPEYGVTGFLPPQLRHDLKVKMLPFSKAF